MTAPPGAQERDARRAAMRLIGWALTLGGLGVLSWLAWMLLATNATTKAAQEDLLEQWLARDGAVAESPVIEGAASADTGGSPPPGQPVAVMEFRRDGERILHAPMVVVQGVTDADLAKGPGRYPGGALPGEPGNLAIAGHRTTHGAPFAQIDQLRPGDEIVLEDQRKRTWTYRVVERRVVEPGDTSVIASDPLGGGKPLLTLTTCHPRYSNRQRLVVFAKLSA